MITKFLFWFVATTIFYTFFGYPLLLVAIERLKKKGARIIQDIYFPYVSFIIAAHNEERSIEKKIQDTLLLDYPQEKLELIIASDNSTDRTNEIVNNLNHPKVKLLVFSHRRGKTYVQNEAVNEAKGEILVFSDATTEYRKDLLKKMVRSFQDKNVGAVAGELFYISKNSTSIGEGNSLYWKYEKFLKRKESNVTSLIGVSGCCYAVRKDDYKPISPDLISDFVTAQVLYKHGKKTVYEPEAVSYEYTNENENDEFRMRVRVAVRSLYGIWQMKELLNPFRFGFFSLQLISHKILRYLFPPLAVILAFLNILICLRENSPVYAISLSLQVAFYASAAIGFLMRKRRTVFYVPYYFCITNFALLYGLKEFLKGERKTIWDPSRK